MAEHETVLVKGWIRISILIQKLLQTKHDNIKWHMKEVTKPVNGESL